MSNPTSKLDHKKLVGVPFWVVLAAFVFGAFVAFFGMSGVGWFAAMTLLVANVIWGLKLFADQKSAIKQLYKNQDVDGALVLAQNKLQVPAWYLVSLGAAVLFPLVWWIATFALKLAVILAVIGALVFIGFAVYKQLSASDDATDKSQSPPSA